MKYANVDGERREAAPGLPGVCPVCEIQLTPRCGRFRDHHWAHPPGTVDHRWEPETSWHQTWKGYFAAEWQEVVHRAADGKRHIADVKTAHGQVIELQNSPISEEERCSREEFYRPMCWIVNGGRLPSERSHFFETLRGAQVVNANPLTLVVPIENCMLLKKWAQSRVLVLYDFGEAEQEGDALHFGAPVLWASNPGAPNGRAVLISVLKSRFLEAMVKGEPLVGLDLSKAFPKRSRLVVPRVIVPPRRWHPRPWKAKRYSSRKHRAWSRSGTRRRWISKGW